MLPHGSLRRFNIPAARLTRGCTNVWTFSKHMKANEAEAGLGRGLAGRFEVFKQRLLHQCLNETPDVETHALIMRQADEAALLAWLTSYPFLTFPCLFEEKASAAAAEARREAHHYWSSLRPELPRGLALNGRRIAML